MGQADQGAGRPTPDRRASARSQRGKLLGLWYAFGDHDGYVLAEAPDTTTIASALITVTASGAFSSLSTTVLLTVEEALEALRQAQGLAYRPPGG